MNPSLAVALLLLASPASAGKADPLAPELAPAIDTDASHYPREVWVTGSMAKVKRNDPPGLEHWALLSAARNEVESFQVHVRAAGDLKGVTLEPSDLVDAKSGGRIRAATGVTVSRELYQKVTEPLRSDANGVWGDIPDALVPARDRYFGETRNVFPADVRAGDNLSAWIDVYVPKGIPSGWYVGSVTVRAAGQAIATLPVRLKVWNVDLPSTASLASHFSMSWNGACVQEYGSYERCGAATARGTPDAGIEHFHVLYSTFGLDRRISIANVTYGPPKDDVWTRFDTLYSPLLDGRADTLLPGARLTRFTYAGGDDPRVMASWVRHFRNRGWLDRMVWYKCDEPGHGTCTFADAKVEGDRAHAASPDFRTLLTADLESMTKHGLLDAVDVATPVLDRMQPHGKESRRALYDDFLSRSRRKQLFWYQSCDQHESCGNGKMGPAQSTWPSYMVDASPMRNRVFQWMAFLERIQGELYYAVDFCFTRECGPAGAITHDPFRSIYAFGGHGDGTLLYPGNTRTIGGKHHIPLSSIRLELIREGMEDFELLRLAEARGEKEFARARASSFIRRADEFASDPARLLTAREAVGDRLHALSLGR
ncbi:MAG: glycoside hydrolase domain-containing protein [Deltaproteobacteria bacterium]